MGKIFLQFFKCFVSDLIWTMRGKERERERNERERERREKEKKEKESQRDHPQLIIHYKWSFIGWRWFSNAHQLGQQITQHRHWLFHSWILAFIPSPTDLPHPSTFRPYLLRWNEWLNHFDECHPSFFTLLLFFLLLLRLTLTAPVVRQHVRGLGSILVAMRCIDF